MGKRTAMQGSILILRECMPTGAFPTPVGNISPSSAFPSLHTVHPHFCGELIIKCFDKHGFALFVQGKTFLNLSNWSCLIFLLKRGQS